MNIVGSPCHSTPNTRKVLSSIKLHFHGCRRHFCASISHESSSTQTQPARVRFAPSPTGQLHFGGLRTALFNYLIARKTGGEFILRIEDTDRSRLVPGAAESIINALRWAKIDYDRGPGKEDEYGPYVQSERKEIYERYSQQLLSKKKAYRCFCDAKKLEEKRKTLRQYSLESSHDECRNLSEEIVKQKLEDGNPFVVRFMTPEQTIDSKPLEARDLVYGQLKFPFQATSEDFVITKSDGMPTYHLASVVDDHLMKITHVIRGEEWISSIPKHIQLYDAFGWKRPNFAHMPIMLNNDKTKMSKRSGDWQIESYIDKGYEPEAILNFVALLGAGWPDSQEVLTMDEMVSMADFNRLNRNRATVDIKRLDHINASHILMKTRTEPGRKDIINGIRRAFNKAGINQSLLPNDKEIDRLVPLIPGRVKPTVSANAVEELGFLLTSVDYSTKEAMKMREKLKNDLVKSLLWGIEILEHIKKDNIALESENIRDIVIVKGAPSGTVMKCFRYALSGKKVGPSLPDMIWALGLDKSIDRLKRVLESEK